MTKQIVVLRPLLTPTACLSTLLILSSIKSPGQTAEDTATWLQTRIQALAGAAPINARVTPVALEFTSYKHFTVQFKDLTSVHFSPAPSGQPRDCKPSCMVAAVVLVSKGDKEGTIAMPLSEATESDGTRIVKAVEHLARLNGAKIVDDNLF